jgi:hypothetical protein
VQDEHKLLKKEKIDLKKIYWENFKKWNSGSSFIPTAAARIYSDPIIEEEEYKEND